MKTKTNRNISANDKLKLWVKAGGRCEFPGCNKYLLEDQFTGHNVKIADKAHIIGFENSINSPRGLDKMKQSERNKESNLMLLCSEHHNKIIDHKTIRSEYNKKLLTEYKQKHEKRIFYVTALDETRRTLIIRMVNRIKDDSVSVSLEEIRLAVLNCSKRYPEYLLKTENNVEINMTDLPQKINSSYWNTGKKIIDRVLNEQLKPLVDRKEVSHISVFALTRIPFLIYLGYKLGDKIKIDIYQKQRNDDESWLWCKGNKNVSFSISNSKKKIVSSNVILLLNLSGKIDLNSLPSSIRDYPIYEINPVNILPNRNIVKTKKTLHNFRVTFQNVLRDLEKKFGHPTKLHLFSALPVSTAIVCGREILKNVSPKFIIYDIVGKEYKKVMEIN